MTFKTNTSQHKTMNFMKNFTVHSCDPYFKTITATWNYKDTSISLAFYWLGWSKNQNWCSLYLTNASHYNMWNVQCHCRQCNLFRNWPSCTSVMIINSSTHFMSCDCLLCTFLLSVSMKFQPQFNDDQWYNVLEHV
jgi:hypothetical protein